ncbi:MAG: phosphoribosylaminoimidazolesuccinocarboxamide synthase [Candidatus Omnitrophica bacterium]|nr:phosphoribosylaminoimidazolesuccinocarboxamide synthase [Candidatus Omnitrophota bacterium]
MNKPLVKLKLPLPLFYSGKVRELYDLGDRLLMVATDRISAFDCTLPTAIPDKGKVLTQISVFWFDYTKEIIPNHLLSAETRDLPESLSSFQKLLSDRIMIVKKAKKIKIECVVRGYFAGSSWKEYQEKGSICGIKLPAGLKQSERLPSPIFTPATKEESGHDQNIDQKELVRRVGAALAHRLEETSLSLYEKAAKYALERGIIIADTKFEFGLVDDQLTLIDELLTPDSSRFWEEDKYRVGISPESLDKQFVRDYLIKIKWDRKPPPPRLPEEIVRKTREKYEEIKRRLIRG